jgi:hypothetical protein
MYFSAIVASAPCWRASPVDPHVPTYTAVIRAIFPYTLEKMTIFRGTLKAFPY